MRLWTEQEHNETAQNELFELKRLRDSASFAAQSEHEAEAEALKEASRRIRYSSACRDMSPFASCPYLPMESGMQPV